MGELQLTHKKTLVDLQDKPEEFVALYRSACGDPTMSAKVPILAVADDTVLIESMVIVEYLEECHGVPQSAAARARCRLWATLVPSWLQWFSVLRTEAGSEAEAIAVAKLRDGLRAMDRLLMDGAGDGPFVLGSDFSLAEAATAPFAQRLVVVLPKLRPELGEPLDWIAADGLTRLSEWMGAVCSRPSCVDTLPPAEVLQESYERLLERFKAMPA